MEIYVHIPFCVKKCNYCDFLSAPADEAVRNLYVEALIKEIRQRANLFDAENKVVTSIYFGGGTPSILTARQIEKIIDEIRRGFSVNEDAEITIEVNPKTADEAKLRKLKEMGFNRLSIGMQSSHDSELKMLGRIHSFSDFEKCFHCARDAGFCNINVDIMTALPGQDEKKLAETLEKAVSFNPEHISAYSLIIEPGTVFYEKYGNIEGPVVGTSLERKLYWQSVDTLAKAGYRHYEISNFARSGFEGKHNMGYWLRTPYLGAGLGAASCICADAGRWLRTRNTDDLAEYLENPYGYSEKITLSRDDIIEETFFLGLRMGRGVDLEAFKERFKVSAESIYADVFGKLTEEGLIEIYNPGNDNVSCDFSEQKKDKREAASSSVSSSFVRLTRKGIDYGNYVFAQFLLQ